MLSFEEKASSILLKSPDFWWFLGRPASVTQYGHVRSCWGEVVVVVVQYDTICEAHIVSSCWGEVVVVVQYDTLWPCEAHIVSSCWGEAPQAFHAPLLGWGHALRHQMGRPTNIHHHFHNRIYVPPVVMGVVGHQHWWAGRPALRKYLCHQMGAMCDHVTVS